MYIYENSMQVTDNFGKKINGIWQNIDDEGFIKKFTIEENKKIQTFQLPIHIHYILGFGHENYKMSVVLENKQQGDFEFIFNFNIVGFSDNIEDVQDIFVKAVGQKSIQMEWTQSSIDINNVDFYEVYCDNSLVLITQKNKCLIVPQKPNQLFTYKVLASNKMGVKTRATEYSIKKINLYNIINKIEEDIVYINNINVLSDSTDEFSTTDTDGLSDLININLYKPISLQIKNNYNANSSEISWYSPKNTIGISSYWVFVGIDGEFNRVRVVPHKDEGGIHKATLTRLNSNKRYTIFVKSADIDGNTSMQSTLVFRNQKQEEVISPNYMGPSAPPTKIEVTPTNRDVNEKIYPPENVDYIIKTEKKISLKWDKPQSSSNIDSYMVYKFVNQKKEAIKEVKVFDKNKKNYDVEIIISEFNKTYKFFVISFTKNKKKSIESNYVSVSLTKKIDEIDGDSEIPDSSNSQRPKKELGVPVNLSLSIKSNDYTSASISWNPPKDTSNISKYNIYLIHSSSSSMVKSIQHNGATKYSTNISGMSATKQYEVVVRSVSKDGNTSKQSNSVFKKIKPSSNATPTPTNVSVPPPPNTGKNNPYYTVDMSWAEAAKIDPNKIKLISGGYYYYYNGGKNKVKLPSNKKPNKVLNKNTNRLVFVSGEANKNGFININQKYKIKGDSNHYLSPFAAWKTYELNEKFKKATNGEWELNIVSSYRDNQLQASLYALYLSGKGNPAAAPFRSSHGNGLAIDVGVINKKGKRERVHNGRTLTRIGNILWDIALKEGWWNAGTKYSSSKTRNSKPTSNEWWHLEIPISMVPDGQLYLLEKNNFT